MTLSLWQLVKVSYENNTMLTTCNKQRAECKTPWCFPSFEYIYMFIYLLLFSLLGLTCFHFTFLHGTIWYTWHVHSPVVGWLYMMNCELLATCSALGYLEGETYHKEADCLGKWVTTANMISSSRRNLELPDYPMLLTHSPHCLCCRECERPDQVFASWGWHQGCPAAAGGGAYPAKWPAAHHLPAWQWQSTIWCLHQVLIILKGWW